MKKRLSVFILCIVIVGTFIGLNPLIVRAAEKNTLFFDNNNTEFDNVYIVAENGLGNWTNYYFHESDNGYLSVEIPASGRKSEIVAEGGVITNYRQNELYSGTNFYFMPNSDQNNLLSESKLILTLTI